VSVQRIVCGIGVVVFLAQAAPVRAQGQTQFVPRRIDPQAAARYQIAVMEGILETAVQRGARTITREWRAVAPDMMMLNGAARARGFRLPGYGLFFDVEVPALAQSVFWSWSVLNRDSAGLSDALQSLRDYIKTVNDPATKGRLEANLRRLEVGVGPLQKSQPGGSDVSKASVVASQSGESPTPVGSGRPAPLTPAGMTGPVVRDVDPTDPNEAYTNEVKNALIEAMLEYSNTLPVEHDEWLTVAARDSGGDRRLGAPDPYDYVTIQIRIKGSDIIALRTGKLTRDEARKRIEIREF
jgi:hypothetical protein